jgi:hypothetical protein
MPPSATPRPSPPIDAVLDAAAHPQRALVDALRALIAGTVPAAVESIKWNAPSFATTEHFATFQLRARPHVQLVLHLGAKPRRDVDLRAVLGADASLLEWKAPDRALLTVRDAAHLDTVRERLERVLRTWASHVG